jgi:hypothetical protein
MLFMCFRSPGFPLFYKKKKKKRKLQHQYVLFMCLRSPGFGMTLVAETTNGVCYTADVCSKPRGSEEPPSVAEDLGTQAAHLLLEEIYRVSGQLVDKDEMSVFYFYLFFVLMMFVTASAITMVKDRCLMSWISFSLFFFFFWFRLQGGCVDSVSQTLLCMLMVTSPQDVSKLLTGPLSPYT